MWLSPCLSYPQFNYGVPQPNAYYPPNIQQSPIAGNSADLYEPDCQAPIDALKTTNDQAEVLPTTDNHSSPCYTSPPVVYSTTVNYHYYEDNRWRAEWNRIEAAMFRQFFKETALKGLREIDGRYTVKLESGTEAPITNFIFSSVKLETFDSQYQMETRYRITINSQSNVEYISQKDFDNNSVFLRWLDTISAGGVIPYGTQEIRATLLRDAALRMMEEKHYSFYGGWRNNIYYSTSDGFWTSAAPGQPTDFDSSYIDIPANAQMAARRYEKTMSAICTAPVKTVCVLIMHAALLTGLINTPLEMAPEFVTSCAAGQTFIKSLLTFGRNDSISSAADTKAFAQALLTHKDQPLVVMEADRGKNSTRNMEMVSQILSEGVVRLGGKGGALETPINTFPVLLRENRMAMTPMNPEQSFVVAVSASDLDINACASETIAQPDFTYYTSFLAFVAAHKEDLLLPLLKQGREAALVICEEDMTPRHAAVYGAMSAVAGLVSAFLEEISVEPENLICKGWQTYFLDLLNGSAELADPAGLTDAFLTAGRRLFTKCIIPIYNTNCPFSAMPVGVAYLDDEYVGVDSATFSAICKKAGCSNPDAVKKDLENQGHFQGARTNGQSYTTRLSISVAGKSTLIRVYKFRREAFEVPGEPSPFEGGDAP